MKEQNNQGSSGQQETKGGAVRQEQHEGIEHERESFETDNGQKPGGKGTTTDHRLISDHGEKAPL